MGDNKGFDDLKNGVKVNDVELNDGFTKSSFSNPENKISKRRKCMNACKNGKWGKLMYNYALETSFHGPKQFTEPQPFIVRRVIWLLIFLAGTAIFLMQTITSIEKYYSFPVTVNVKINYNTSILFPAVTICNSNAFRSTESYKNGYYNLITDVYNDPNFTSFSKYGTTPNLEVLYRETGHSLDDLIVSCSWSGVKCSSKDFMVKMTDYGRCFTFNGINDPNKQRKAYQTGTNGGLKLKLNIEQYKYMIGPNEEAGLKVLIHNPSDIPLVKDHGLAIPPGSHALIGIKTLSVNNLPPRYGICNDTAVLEHFDDYTIPNCFTDCKEKYFKKKCQCRDIYMPPSQTSTSSICNIDVYNSCMKKATEDFYTKIKETCECPVPCHSILYDSGISYGSISNFDIQALLRNNVNGTLDKKFVNAREINQRVDKNIIQEDKKLIEDMVNVVSKLDTVFEMMHHDIHNAKHLLTDTYQKMLKRIKFHSDRGLDAVKFIAEHDFSRGWQVYKERAYHYVTLDFMDFPNRLKNVILRSNSTVNDINSRMLLYSPIYSLFLGRQDLLTRATDYINISRIAYLTGEPLLTYQLTYQRQYDMSYITLPLLHVGKDENEEQFIQLMSGIDKMNAGLDLLMQVGEQFVDTGYFNESAFLNGEDLFVAGGRRFNYRLFMFESRVVDTPVAHINNKITEFERLNRSLYDNQYNVMWRLNQIEILHDNSVAHWKQAKQIAELSANYMKNISMQKAPLGLELTSTQFAESIRLLAVFFQEIRSRITQLQDMLTVLSISYKETWSAMLLEGSTAKFYAHLYNDTEDFLQTQSISDRNFYLKVFSQLLRTSSSKLSKLNDDEIILLLNGNFSGYNISEFFTQLDDYFLHLKTVLDISVRLSDKDALFLSSITNLQSSMQKFIDGNKIGVSFFKENFMNLNVFMQELSFEEISQQKGYDIPQMLSEIGGSMGLFIGGSALSAFELFDVFIHHGAKLVFHR